MKNKRNKKLLSSVLMALSLSSSVSFNNKIANANYKDNDRTNFKSFVDELKLKKNNNADLSSLSSKLAKLIVDIYKHRASDNPIQFFLIR